MAAAYHVNPAQVWSNDGQTYASVKENARSLYSDTLGPYLAMMRADIERRLVPIIGADPRSYAEFDLTTKLAGSFEEQASFLSQSTGGPWMLRNEARARMNLPAVEGGDELIVPMNVTEGGLASPHDTAPDKGAPPVGYAGDGVVHALPGAKGRRGTPQKASPDGSASGDKPNGPRAVVLKSVGEPPEDSVSEIESCLVRFQERQSKRVLADMAKGARKAGSRAKVGGEGCPTWWDAVRWNRELADDLETLFRALCDLRGAATMADIKVPASTWSSARTANFVRAMAERRAEMFNEGTYQDLASAMAESGEGDAGAVGSAERVFLDKARNRAVRGARTFATAVSGFATKEAVRQAYPKDTERVRRTKTWRHHASKQPRGKHASMDGETVGLDERFSNGADWPGDYALVPAETCSCHCRAWGEAERRPGKSEDAVTSLNRNIERRSETSLPCSSLNP